MKSPHWLPLSLQYESAGQRLKEFIVLQPEGSELQVASPAPTPLWVPSPPGSKWIFFCLPLGRCE